MSDQKVKRKIVLITPMLQPYRITFYQKLAKAVSNQADLIVYHGTKTKEDGRPSYNGDIPFAEKGFPIMLMKLFSLNIVIDRGMVKSLKKENPDLVIMQGIGGDVSLRLVSKWIIKNHKRLILWTCGWEPGRAKGWLLSLKNKLVSIFFSRADYHLTYSTKASEYVNLMGVDPSIISTCYNGIETDDMEAKSKEILKESQKIRQKYELDSSITFIYVGGLIVEKRVDVLIDAFNELHKRYSNIKLIIIGDGPERKTVEEKLQVYQDPGIIYLGRIIEGVDSYIAASDCLVLPGIGGLALNQAMFWGKPCIVSKADGTEDDLVIDGVSGYRFNENDFVSLVSAMERRINDSEINVTMLSQKSREIIKNKSNVNNMVHIFSKTIEVLLKT